MKTDLDDVIKAQLLVEDAKNNSKVNAKSERDAMTIGYLIFSAVITIVEIIVMAIIVF